MIFFQRLVEASGYSAIAVESSFPQGPIINDYVLGRGPASYAAVQDTGWSHGFGTFEANRELVEWMRHYNADPAHQLHDPLSSETARHSSYPGEPAHTFQLPPLVLAFQ
jgi:erythromycin esterase-like protein